MIESKTIKVYKDMADNIPAVVPITPSTTTFKTLNFYQNRDHSKSTFSND